MKKFKEAKVSGSHVPNRMFFIVNSEFLFSLTLLSKMADDWLFRSFGLSPEKVFTSTSHRLS